MGSTSTRFTRCGSIIYPGGRRDLLSVYLAILVSCVLLSVKSAYPALWQCLLFLPLSSRPDSGLCGVLQLNVH